MTEAAAGPATVPAFERGRFQELDLLRGVAALWVVLFHYLRRYHEIYGGAPVGFPNFPDGLYGVKRETACSVGD